VRLARTARYRSAGTVEFVLDAATGEFFFLEVNTRIQVEHGVTEEVTRVDLIEWMVRLAAGNLPDLDELSCGAKGAAIEARLYAEDPQRGFRPSSGVLSEAVFPDDVRIETWVEAGTAVTPFYDPMLAKIIARGVDRADAIARLREALTATRVAGVETNRGYIVHALDAPEFRAGRVHTGLLDTIDYATPTIEVLESGTQTTVQDHPGRLGHWDVGVPPSGRWMRCRFVSAIASSAIRAMRPASNARSSADAPCRYRRRHRADGRGHGCGARRATVASLPGDKNIGGQCFALGGSARSRQPSLPLHSRRARRSGIPREPRDLHARSLRGHAAERSSPATCSTSVRRAPVSTT